MRHEEYPEKIYAVETWGATRENIKGGVWINSSSPTYKGESVDSIEYIRSDIFENLLGKEYKVGFEEGSVFGANDNWHKYPEEKPKKEGKYLTTYIRSNGTASVRQDHFLGEDWVFSSSSISGCLVIAWRELPEPYKED